MIISEVQILFSNAIFLEWYCSKNNNKNKIKCALNNFQEDTEGFFLLKNLLEVDSAFQISRN